MFAIRAERDYVVEEDFMKAQKSTRLESSGVVWTPFCSSGSGRKKN